MCICIYILQNVQRKLWHMRSKYSAMILLHSEIKLIRIWKIFSMFEEMLSLYVFVNFYSN